MKLLQTCFIAGVLLATSLGAQARALLDGDYELLSWQVKGQTLSAGIKDEQQRPVTMSIKAGHVSGFAGCNRYTGQIQTGNGLKIGPLAATRMACLDTESAEKERDVMAILNSASRYQFSPNGQLAFIAGADQLVFVRKARTTEKIVQIAPETMPCTAGAAKMDCLQVREKVDAPWQLLYGGIEGFNYAPGKLYTLRIAEAAVANPPADGSSVKRTLLQIISTYSEEDGNAK